MPCFTKPATKVDFPEEQGPTTPITKIFLVIVMDKQIKLRGIS